MSNNNPEVAASISDQALAVVKAGVLDIAKYPDSNTTGHAFVGALMAGANEQQAEQIAIEVCLSDQYHNTYLGGAAAYLSGIEYNEGKISG